jgi:hypothetical protein
MAYDATNQDGRWRSADINFDVSPGLISIPAGTGRMLAAGWAGG